MPPAQRFTQHSTSSLGKPVIDRREYHKNDRADQYIMKMCHHEVGVGELPIPGSNGEHDTGQARDQELKEKCQAEEHWNPKVQFPAPDGPEPVEDLDAGWDTDQHCGGYEE